MFTVIIQDQVVVHMAVYYRWLPRWPLILYPSMEISLQIFRPRSRRHHQYTIPSSQYFDTLTVYECFAFSRTRQQYVQWSSDDCMSLHTSDVRILNPGRVGERKTLFNRFAFCTR
ncbi:hypothetical protein CLF_109685 [Clonorchis sinensis]|uniref:Uncharacterized protein n=1 Tax=Clonorchis sinensis TaxID=79923 RepID=G7YSV7_CLOSI|nr:hypothetical protein CLF_109685 [Clonorchis sinensis]